MYQQLASGGGMTGEGRRGLVEGAAVAAARVLGGPTSYTILTLMELTITHMVLVHKRTTLWLDALDTTHILIMMIVSHVGLVFSLELLTLTLS
jgi:hypothetical protein